MCHHIVSKQYAVVHHADMTLREFRRTFFCLPGSEQYARFPEKIYDLCLTQAGCERLRSDIAMDLS
ncbi:hypothetical protein CFR72_06450 [Gluconacetobacter entanii]|uniref:Uncharacterized protein n=2 Tax=Gluconacetobacter entanii TaxID=108528 RepID=A0A318Q3M9_9PROT|nr:hypothetical protein CFR72_06450 [Gluconacetobacter entanii]